MSDSWRFVCVCWFFLFFSFFSFLFFEAGAERPFSVGSFFCFGGSVALRRRVMTRRRRRRRRRPTKRNTHGDCRLNRPTDDRFGRLQLERSTTKKKTKKNRKKSQNSNKTNKQTNSASQPEKKADAKPGVVRRHRRNKKKRKEKKRERERERERNGRNRFVRSAPLKKTPAGHKSFIHSQNIDEMRATFRCLSMMIFSGIL